MGEFGAMPLPSSIYLLNSHSHWVFAKTNHSYIDESYLFFKTMECLVARTGTFIIVIIIIIPYICIALVVSLSGFPGGSVVKDLPAMQELQETWVQSLGQEDPLEEGMATHSSILAWRIPWTWNLVSYSPWGHKELDMTEAT